MTSSPFTLPVNRALDAVLAALLILVVLPLALLLGLSTCLEDRGPILYLQRGADRTGRVFNLVFLVLLLLLASPSLQAQDTTGFTSGNTRVIPADTARFPNRIDPLRWDDLLSSTSFSVPNDTTPDGSQYIQFVFTGGPGLAVHWVPSNVMDIEPFDTLSFWFLASKEGYYWVSLNDLTGRHLTFTLFVRPGHANTWVLHEFDLRSPGYADPTFDRKKVWALRLNPDRLPPVGFLMSVSTPVFDTEVISYCESAELWSLDFYQPGVSSITTSTDARLGAFSILADITTPPNFGQASIALSGLDRELRWNLAAKKYVSFLYKHSHWDASNYFLVYDENRNYRIWLFSNQKFIGEWAKVVITLSDIYYESGPVDLSKIIYIEFGVWNVTPGLRYVFKVDHVQAH